MGRYLGVFVSGRTLKYNFDHAKAHFFGAFNAVYGEVDHLASEEVILSLLRSKCLPVPRYDLPGDLRAVVDSAKFRQQLKTYFLLELLMFSDFRPAVFNVLSDSCNALMFRL